MEAENDFIPETDNKSLIAVLRSMVDEESVGRYFLISEITERSGLEDDRDVQRSLYILEGQKLVAPLPEGDFTSKHWQLTDDGRKILPLIKD